MVPTPAFYDEQLYRKRSNATVIRQNFSTMYLCCIH